ncbi:MAG TPA: hypothetical protein ENI76_02790 [Ignavibacteria bacterium]|nr:hypothetical protein [Ignavibacteria bacterium]
MNFIERLLIVAAIVAGIALVTFSFGCGDKITNTTTNEASGEGSSIATNDAGGNAGSDQSDNSDNSIDNSDNSVDNSDNSDSSTTGQ